MRKYLTEKKLENFITSKVISYLKENLNEVSMDSMDRDSQMHTIVLDDGTQIRMTHKNFLKWRRDKKKEQEGNTPNRRGRRNPTVVTGDELAPSQLHDKIKKLLLSAAPLESLATFRNHAYRSYGTIADRIMQPFDSEYSKYISSYEKVKNRLNNILKWGAKNEYETYEEARMLSFDVEEMQIALIDLSDKIRANRKQIQREYGNLPIYNGRNNGKELGFADQLFCKSPRVIAQTLGNLKNAADEIAKIADKGRNPLDYDI